MASWTRYSGAPGTGDAPPAWTTGAGKQSVAARARAARRVAWGILLLTAWAGAEVALVAVRAAGAAAPAWLARLAPFLPGALVERGIPGFPALVVDVLVLAAAWTLGGLLVHAAGLAISTGGASPAWPPLARAWRARSGGGLLGGARGSRFAGLVHARTGFAAAAAVLADAAVTPAARALGRARGEAWDRVHADVPLDALAEAMEARGFGVREGPDRLLVDVPPPPAEVRIGAERGVRGRRAGDAAARERVTVRPRRVRVPPVDAARVLDLTGPARAVRRVRRAIEDDDVAFAGTFAWSDEARRLEARVNAIARDAARAVTVADRGALHEEARAVAGVVMERDLVPEERAVLERKLARVREGLQASMLALAGQEPPPPRAPEWAVAPAGTLAPRLTTLVTAGGLGRVRRVAYAPFLVVPVATGCGEQALAVDAVTGTCQPDESRGILDACREEGTTLLVERARSPRFLAAPAGARDGAGAASELRRVLRRELGYWGPVRVVGQAAEVVYVPFVEADDGRVVNALTGREAAPELARRVRESLRDALPEERAGAEIV